MSDLRERFERHQAGLLNIDYEELRDQFDRHEEIFGKRYVTFSDFEKEFELWQACWSHQQAIIDEHTEVIKLQDADLRKYEKQIESLKAQLNNMEACYIEKKKECEDRQKRIDDGLEKIHQFGKEGCLFPEWLIWAEKTLRGAND